MDNPFEILLTKMIENTRLLQKLQADIDLLIQQKKEIYLSPEEARKMFSPAISPATLHRWQKKGLVKRHFMGKKVCYKLSEIEESVKTLRPNKYNQTADN